MRFAVMVTVLRASAAAASTVLVWPFAVSVTVQRDPAGRPGKKRDTEPGPGVGRDEEGIGADRTATGHEDGDRSAARSRFAFPTCPEIGVSHGCPRPGSPHSWV